MTGADEEADGIGGGGVAAGPDSDPDGPSPVSEDAASKVWLEPERSMPSDAVGTEVPEASDGCAAEDRES